MVTMAQRVATRFRVAARFKAAMEMPEPGKWTIKDLEEWHAQTPKPRSAYDKVPEAQRPFGWSTPAPATKGEMPKPWRVAHADRATALLKKMFPQHKDIYVDYGDGAFRGKLQLWVGLRDNRDAEAHSARMEEVADGLQKANYKIRFQKQGNRVVLHLLDDLEKDVLKS